MLKHKFQSVGKRCTPSWSILPVLGFKCVYLENTGFCSAKHGDKNFGLDFNCKDAIDFETNFIVNILLILEVFLWTN